MVTIEVRQSHITKGDRCNSYRCPIALAIREYTAIGVIVSVETNCVFFNGHHTVGLPDNAIWFIRCFDDSVGSYDVPPTFSFKFDIPDEYLL